MTAVCLEDLWCDEVWKLLIIMCAHSLSHVVTMEWNMCDMLVSVYLWQHFTGGCSELSPTFTGESQNLITINMSLMFDASWNSPSTRFQNIIIHPSNTTKQYILSSEPFPNHNPSHGHLHRYIQHSLADNCSITIFAALNILCSIGKNSWSVRVSCYAAQTLLSTVILCAALQHRLCFAARAVLCNTEGALQHRGCFAAQRVICSTEYQMCNTIIINIFQCVCVQWMLLIVMLNNVRPQTTESPRRTLVSRGSVTRPHRVMLSSHSDRCVCVCVLDQKHGWHAAKRLGHITKHCSSTTYVIRNTTYCALQHSH